MREYKFRAWDKDTKKMITSSLCIHICGNQTIQCNDLIFIQYTGLKDKNGREIYEGDIVKGYDHKTHPSGGFVDDVIGVMKYQGLMFAIQGKQINSKEKWFYTMDTPPLNGQDRHMEVIGNIYENPELLK